MNKYSSTLAKMFSGNCPHALGLYEARTPCDNDIFQVGIAAHAVLEVCAQKGALSIQKDQEVIGNAVALELITHGRAFAGNPEPPMQPEHAFDGRDLALQWLSWNDLPEGGIAEGGYGITKDGKPCGYDDKQCRYNAILDLIYFEISGDEDYSCDTAVVRDYKSAWPTDDKELDTLQRRGQAVVAWRHYGHKVQAIRLEVVNLRTGATFSRIMPLNDDNIALLELWEKDILAVCDAMDKTREPRPGAGCLDCKYTLGCDHCLDYYKDSGEDAAVSFATSKAVTTQLSKVMQARTKDHKFQVHGGYVGYRECQKKILKINGIKELVENWCDGEDDLIKYYVRGILRAGDITPTTVTNIIDILYPNKKDAARLDLLDQTITTITDKRFGVHKL